MTEAIISIVAWAREQGVGFWQVIGLAVLGCAMLVLMKVAKGLGGERSGLLVKYDKIFEDLRGQILKAVRERDDAIDDLNDMRRELEHARAILQMQNAQAYGRRPLTHAPPGVGE